MGDDAKQIPAAGGSRRISFGRRRGTGGSAAVTVQDATTNQDALTADPVVTPVPLSKGRPTPKRSEAQRRRGGPVPPPPTTRKEAAKRLREQRADGRSASTPSRERMLRRDAGPVRQAVRDVVDSRRNIAVVLLPVALLLFIAGYSHNPQMLSIMTRVWIATLLAVVLDVVIIGLSVRRRLAAEPVEGGMTGHVFYGLARSTVVRRFRSPKPQVAPPKLFGSR